MLTDQSIKLCQSCIERGFNPANPATREWQDGLLYCEDCFQALLNNLTNIPAAAATSIAESVRNGATSNGPILDTIYKVLGIPKELQFDKVDTVCRKYDQIFNFAAPAIVNMNDIDALAKEIEEREMALFYIKYTTEPLQLKINKLKEERRAERNLKSYSDSKEEYAKGDKKTSKVKTSQEEKTAKALGMTLEEFKDFQKKAREREFNKMAGNCPECGGKMPCALHPGK